MYKSKDNHILTINDLAAILRCSLARSRWQNTRR